MKSTTSEALIQVLRRLFTTHGLPDLIVSDNGPQFTVNSFEMFLAEQGIRHALSALGKPSTNGLAERMVRSTKETLMRLGPGDIQAKIDKLLAVQHITPSATTHRSPVELLMGRKLRSSLDRLHPQYSSEKPTDSMSRVREFQEGEKFYAKNLNGSSYLCWVPAEITQVMGPISYRVQMEDGQHWKRHIDQLRGRVSRDESQPQKDRQERWKERNTTAGAALPQSRIENSNPERNTGNLSEAQGEEPDPGEECQGQLRGAEKEIEQNRSNPAPEFERVPETAPGDQRNSTSHSENTESTDLRRSSRAPRHPAYLRDYVAQRTPDWQTLN